MKALVLSALATLSLFASSLVQAAIIPELRPPQAGFEFPTEMPEPSHLAPYQVLIITESLRILVPATATLDEGALVIDDFVLPVAVKKAVAGIDYPSHGPANLDRNFLVWALTKTNRIRVSSIAKIIPAEAGIDYPTDTPPQGFHVMVLKNGERIALDR